MSASIATLPRPGNGHILLGSAIRFLKDLFSSKHPAAVTEVQSKPANELSVWQLYRLTVGYDSISPKTAAELRKQLVG